MDDQRTALLAREFGDAELAGLLVAARSEVVQAVPQHVSRRHLAQVLAAAGAVAGATAAGAGSAMAATGAGAAAATGSGATTGAASAAGVAGASSGAAAAGAAGGLGAIGAAKLAAAGAALIVTAGTGLAVTGNLPFGAQDAVADVAGRVGIELPRSQTGPPEAPPPVSPATEREAPGSDLEREPERDAPGQDVRDETPRRDEVARDDEGRDASTEGPPGRPDDNAGVGEPSSPAPSDSSTDTSSPDPAPSGDDQPAPPGQSDRSGKASPDRGGPHTPLDEAGKNKAGGKGADAGKR